MWSINPGEPPNMLIAGLKFDRHRMPLYVPYISLKHSIAPRNKDATTSSLCREENKLLKVSTKNGHDIPERYVGKLRFLQAYNCWATRINDLANIVSSSPFIKTSDIPHQKIWGIHWKRNVTIDSKNYTAIASSMGTPSTSGGTSLPRSLARAVTWLFERGLSKKRAHFSLEASE